MKASVYELIQKRKELLKDIENLRTEREEEAVEKKRLEDREDVEEISLEEFDSQRQKLADKITEVTVTLREQNVSSEIQELGMNPEEVRIKRDMLDREIEALRNLTGKDETSYLGSSEVVKVSRIDQDELDRLLEKLTEKRGKLDTALQRFNLETEVEVEI